MAGRVRDGRPENVSRKGLAESGESGLPRGQISQKHLISAPLRKMRPGRAFWSGAARNMFYVRPYLGTVGLQHPDPAFWSF